VKTFTVGIALAGLVAYAHGTADDRAARFASGAGALGYVGLGLAFPLLQDGALGREHFFRAIEALGFTLAATEGLKRATRVPRPGTGEHDSFPSAHASAAFAIATMQATFHPREAPFWYAGAALIADSRLALHRHREMDVLAGAALGFLTARAELSSKRGWVVSPLLGDSFGVVASSRF
jgi:membrane-associated phospholipid phosphatase